MNKIAFKKSSFNKGLVFKNLRLTFWVPFDT